MARRYRTRGCKKRRKTIEANDGRRLCDWFDEMGWIYTHVSNQTTSERNTENLKSQGLQPGFPDYLVFWPRHIAIELKKPGDRPRDNQFQWLQKLHRCGWSVTWGTFQEVKQGLTR